MPLPLTSLLCLALDPAAIFRHLGLTPDPWQRRFLLSPHPYALLNCSRQSGKSTAVAVLALHTALFSPRSLTLLLSPTLRQSGELFRKVLAGYDALGPPLRAVTRNGTSLELANGARVVSLPGREATVRGFANASLLLIDEAARVPDDLYRGVRPMLAVSRGRLVCLSTPFGRRGFFHREWEDDTAPWHRVRVPWQECPRIAPDFIAAETRALGAPWVRQEYETSFEALEGLVYPDFERLAAVDDWPNPAGKRVGGIDFGFRNPFAAVAGVLDHDDVLWIGHERYRRATPIHEHAAALPRDVLWFADPAGRTETEELRRAGLTVRRAANDLRAGIAAVTARLRTGRLKIHRPACPDLLAEAKLYRYPNPRDQAAPGETPIDDHNHALAALRYLIATTDAGFLARFRRPPETLHPAPLNPPTDDDYLWTPVS